ncbi:MAG: hypothetical protein IT445_15555 [Phycisphaeraceae bacterium]|nr:hypothetical protein [Phycisphaeraceae bacterium]
MRSLICLLLALCCTAAQAESPLRHGENVLFLGDDLTQQMFFSQAAATCLMSLDPTGDQRFFNGGKDGAMAGDAVEWCRPLMQRTQPSVVVICFGLNDAQLHEAEQYELDLSNLIAAVRQYPSVQASSIPGGVIVMSPPALPKAEVGPKLRQFTDVAQRVAQTERALFVDIQRPMRQVYDQADKELLKQLTLGDRLPGELMHMVIASHVLQAMGVSTEQVQRVGWSPLAPGRMGLIRPHLAWADTAAADPELAGSSRRLYLSLARCDELFFRIWRLPAPEGGKVPESDPLALEKALKQAWASAIQQATVFAGLQEQ